MEATVSTYHMEEPAYPELTNIPTNLYELIEAINEEVDPVEDWLVTEVVLDLLSNGKIRFQN